MATLEESLVLHDKFTQTMNKADQATQKIIGSFERLHELVSKGLNFDPNIKMPKNVDKMFSKDLEVKVDTESAMDKLTRLNNKSEELFNQLDQSSHQLEEAFSLGELKGVNEALAKYDQLYDELVKVQTQANKTAETMANVGSKSTMNTRGENGVSPPTTRVERIKLQADTAQANNAFQRFTSVVTNSMNTAKSKIAEMQSFNRGVAQSVSNSLSNAFNKIPLVNSLTNRVNALKQALISTQASSDRFNDSMTRVGRNSQNYSKVSMGLTRIKSTIAGVIMSFMGMEKASDRVNNSMSRVARNEASYGRLRSTFNLLKSSAQSFADTLSKSNTPVGRLYQSISKLVNPLRNASNESQKLNDNLGKVANQGGALSRISNIMTFAVAIQALRTMANIMQSLTSYADEYVGTMNRLRIATDATESVDDFSERIMASAIRARTAYSDVANTVSRFAINARDAFNGNDEVLTFTENLNKLYKIGGATLAEQQGSMVQLTQAMARGTLRGEELNSVWEQGPLIIQQIADYLDVSMGKLKAMADEGEITADVVKAAILSATDSINQQFNSMDMTFGQMVENMKTISIGAFQPLIESWNNFINSVIGQDIFNYIGMAIYAIGEIGNWAFNYILVPAITWVVSNLNVLALAFVIVGTIALSVAAVMAIAWMAANWPLLLTIAIIAMVVMALNAMGVTAGQVAGYIVGVITFVGLVFYDVLVFIVGLFTTAVQVILNVWKYFANMIASVAEFFVNVWSNPIYSVRKLFYNMVSNVLDLFGTFVSGAGSAADALGQMFVNGVNIAIRALNKLIELMNKIPGVSIGTVGEASYGGSASGAYNSFANGIKGALDPGDAPSNYWKAPQFEMGAIDGMTNALGAMKNPVSGAVDAYNATNNTISNLGSGFGNMMDKFNNLNLGQNDINKNLANLYDPSNFGGGNGGGGNGGGGKGSGGKSPGSGKGSGGSGKTPKTNVGTVDKIKDEVNIADEDLKYLRDVAERNFVLKFEQITPSATVNFTGNGNTEEDAKKLLELMETMIQEQSSQALKG